jgi:hypothetical protein
MPAPRFLPPDCQGEELTDHLADAQVLVQVIEAGRVGGRGAALVAVRAPRTVLPRPT